MIDKHHAHAKEKGVKIVNSCGFDCVPVDLGTWMVSQEMPVTPVSIRVLVTRANGGASGGTLESAKGNLAWSRLPENKAKSIDPYVLAPDASEALRVDSKWTTKRGI